ncbi:hypothetical protein Hte_010526 [Hypoxylon texense]
MGQFTSSSARSEEQPQLPPVQNIEQFQDRLRQLLRNRCLSRQEEDWFRSVFGKFSSPSETSETSPTWTESDLVEFLGATLPDELKPALKAAGPLIYRCMVRIGSFPYQNQPVSTLTADVTTVATIVLLRRHESSASAISDVGTGDDGGEVRWAEWLRRILFQSMAIRDSLAADHRTASDDEDLLRAHQFVSSSNQWRDWERNPRVAYAGPPIIPTSELPSSRSQDLSGFIPKAELEALIKLLLASQLYLTGNGPEILALEGEQLDASVDSTTAAFHQSEKVPGITWESFNGVLSESPSIFSGFTRLFAPLVLEGGIRREQMNLATRDEASRLLRGAFSVSRPESIPKGIIFDLPILAELVTFLPEGRLAFQSASVLYTTNDKFETSTLESHLGKRSQPLVLLISGVASGPEKSRSSTSTCIGVFLPDRDQEKRQIETGKAPIHASLFELRPVHRVFSFPESTVTIGKGAGGIAEIRFAEGSGHLTLNEQTQTANFYPRGQGHNEDGSAGPLDIQVNAVDLIGFPSGKDLFDLPTDKTFFVGPTPGH